MIPRPGSDRPPGPELLAAYADGELDADPALAPVREKVEAWLAGHPEARREVERHRRLRLLWQTTAPPEPAEEAWEALRARLGAARTEPCPEPSRPPLVWGAALLGAAAALFLVWAHPPFGGNPGAGPADPPAANVTAQPGEEPGEPWAVAEAAEVEVLSVAGDDTHTLVVGTFPVQGPLELAAPGDVTFTSVQPAEGDNMLPVVRTGRGSAPLIWSRLDTEGEEP